MDTQYGKIDAIKTNCIMELNTYLSKEVYMTSKYSEKQYNRAIERLDEIKELLRQPETDMFESYKLYSEELKLLEVVYDYELTNLEHKYEPLEARVQFLKDESYMDLFFSFRVIYNAYYRINKN